MGNKKIPTPVALFLLLLLIGVTIAGIESATRQTTKATQTFTPQNVLVTNISDTSFSVTWMTSEKTTGAVLLHESALQNTTIPDDRDQKGILGPYIMHMATVRNLKPDTPYSFSILVDGKTHKQITGKPFQVQTGKTLTDTAPPSLEPAYGNIMKPDGTPASDTLIFIRLEESQTLSAITKENGSWLISLNLMRTEDTQAYLASKDRITEHLTARHLNDTATAISDTLNDAPIPDITLGKEYDFRKTQAKNLVASSPLADATLTVTTPTPDNVLGEHTATLKDVPKVQLSQPKDGDAIPSDRPLIQGTGVPGKRVTLTLGITNPISDTTIVGNDGIFRYTPVKALGSGKQSVTITTTGPDGRPIAIHHEFTILKSGTQVLGEATPSATLAPSPTVYISPTPFPTPIASPTAQTVVPVTASPMPTIILGILGTLLILSGGILFIH